MELAERNRAKTSRGSANEYADNYQGMKFMTDSDGKTRFMDSEGRVKIRSESGHLFEDNLGQIEIRALRRSTRPRAERFVSLPDGYLSTSQFSSKTSSKMPGKVDGIFGSSSPSMLGNFHNKKLSESDNSAAMESGKEEMIKSPRKNKEVPPKASKNGVVGIEDSDNDEDGRSGTSTASSTVENKEAKLIAAKYKESPKFVGQDEEEAAKDLLLNASFQSKSDGSKRRGREKKKARRSYLSGEYIAEKILGDRGSGKGKEYLLKWFGYEDSTWELASNFKQFYKLIEEYEERKTNGEVEMEASKDEGEQKELSRKEESGEQRQTKRVPKKRRTYALMDGDAYQAKRSKVDRELISEKLHSPDQQQKVQQNVEQLSPRIQTRQSGRSKSVSKKSTQTQKSVGSVEKSNEQKAKQNGNAKNSSAKTTTKASNREESADEENDDVTGPVNGTPLQTLSPPAPMTRRRRNSRPDAFELHSKTLVAETVADTPLSANLHHPTIIATWKGGATTTNSPNMEERGNERIYAVSRGAIPTSIVRMRSRDELELLVKYQSEQFSDEWIPLSVFTQFSQQDHLNQFIFRFMFKVCNMLRERGIELADIAP